MSFQEKKDALEKVMQEYAKEDIMIAFSGGVDSSLLLKIACDSAIKQGSKVYAITLHTMLHPMSEIENARKVAKEAGAIHIVLEVDELQEAGIINNPVDRCYRCKHYLFQQIQREADKFGIKVILEGTNEDDLHVYRPGIKALKELGILSPLANLGITKEEVRKLAAQYGISTSKKPSAPCLATRFPYHTNLSYEMMRNVELGEVYLKKLGLFNLRLRIHGDIVRIEVDEEDLSKVLSHKTEIIQYLKTLGYTYITIDLEGFRSGSMDIHLK